MRYIWNRIYDGAYVTIYKSASWVPTNLTTVITEAQWAHKGPRAMRAHGAHTYKSNLRGIHMDPGSGGMSNH